MEQENDPTSDITRHLRSPDPTMPMEALVPQIPKKIRNESFAHRGGRLLLIAGISVAATSAGDAIYLHHKATEMNRLTLRQETISNLYNNQAERAVWQGAAALSASIIGLGAVIATSRREQ